MQIESDAYRTSIRRRVREIGQFVVVSINKNHYIRLTRVKEEFTESTAYLWWGDADFKSTEREAVLHAVEKERPYIDWLLAAEKAARSKNGDLSPFRKGFDKD